MGQASPHRVFVTGASGFVGCEVVAQLLSRGCSVVALARRPMPLSRRDGLQVVHGDLSGGGDWPQTLAGCDAVIHLVGIIREAPGATFQLIHEAATKTLVAAARQAGVRRFVHMSALGTRANARSAYHRTKWGGEQAVRASQLDWTIFRPSLIHGPRGEFAQMLMGWARGRLPIMPCFAGGLLGTRRARVQPVYVGDVGRAFVEALDTPAAVGQTYDLVGPTAMTWPGFYREFAAAIGCPRAWPIAIPAWVALAVATASPARWLPFTRDQVLMAQEEQVGDSSGLLQDFGWQPRAIAAVASCYRADSGVGSLA